MAMYPPGHQAPYAAQQHAAAFPSPAYGYPPPSGHSPYGLPVHAPATTSPWGPQLTQATPQGLPSPAGASHGHPTPTQAPTRPHHSHTPSSSSSHFASSAPITNPHAQDIDSEAISVFSLSIRKTRTTVTEISHLNGGRIVYVGTEEKVSGEKQWTVRRADASPLSAPIASVELHTLGLDRILIGGAGLGKGQTRVKEWLMKESKLTKDVKDAKGCRTYETPHGSVFYWKRNKKAKYVELFMARPAPPTTAPLVILRPRIKADVHDDEPATISFRAGGAFLLAGNSPQAAEDLDFVVMSALLMERMRRDDAQSDDFWEEIGSSFAEGATGG